jgi:hypothetical protein
MYAIRHFKPDKLKPVLISIIAPTEQRAEIECDFRVSRRIRAGQITPAMLT